LYPKQGLDYPQLPDKLNPRYYHKTDIFSTSDIIYAEFMVKTFIADPGIGRIITRTQDISQARVILLFLVYFNPDFERHLFRQKLQGFLR